MTVEEYEEKYGVELVPKFATQILGGADVAAQMHARLANSEQEVVVLLTLDSQHRVIREVEVFKGTVNESTLHPRDIFREAVRDNAVSIIIAHNQRQRSGCQRLLSFWGLGCWISLYALVPVGRVR